MTEELDAADACFFGSCVVHKTAPARAANVKLFDAPAEPAW
jgi:hypothetical protein